MCRSIDHHTSKVTPRRSGKNGMRHDAQGGFDIAWVDSSGQYLNDHFALRCLGLGLCHAIELQRVNASGFALHMQRMGLRGTAHVQTFFKFSMSRVWAEVATWPPNCLMMSTALATSWALLSASTPFSK